MDLREATSWLLRVTDPASQLRLADNYIQTYNKLPSRFILPSAHKNLQPIIEAFANDVNGLVAYIRAIRDASEGGAYDELHDLYRTVSIRALQQTRRARIGKGVALVEKEVGRRLQREIHAEDRVTIARYIEQMWGAMRLEYMSAERSLRKADRLSSEERNIVLEEFWKKIDAELADGRVPIRTKNDMDDLTEKLR
jgi:hypothetical protein